MSGKSKPKNTEDAASSDKGYVAYLDLLGFKEDVHGNSEIYENRIKLFYRAIFATEGCFLQVDPSQGNPNEPVFLNPGNTKMMVLTDSLIIYTSDLPKLLLFISTLRLNLILPVRSSNDSGFPIFFRAAIAFGSLKHIDYKSYVFDHIDKVAAKFSIVTGSGFNDSIIEAYTTEENTKGICINVSKIKEKLERRSKRTDIWGELKNVKVISNFYVSSSKSGITSKYSLNQALDLSFDRLQLTTDLTDRILDAAIKASLFTEKAACYYIPLIVNLIKSSDLTRISARRNHDDLKKEVDWYVFHELFIGNVFRELSGLPCVHIIPLLALVKIIEFENTIAKKKQIEKGLDQMSVAPLDLNSNHFHIELFKVKKKIVRLAGLRVFVKHHSQLFFTHEKSITEETRAHIFRAITRHSREEEDINRSAPVKPNNSPQ